MGPEERKWRFIGMLIVAMVASAIALLVTGLGMRTDERPTCYPEGFNGRVWLRQRTPGSFSDRNLGGFDTAIEAKAAAEAVGCEFKL